MMPAQLAILDNLTRQNAALHALLDRWDAEYADSVADNPPGSVVATTRAARAREIREALRQAKEVRRCL